MPRDADGPRDRQLIEDAQEALAAPGVGPAPNRRARLEPADESREGGGERGVELDPSALSPDALRGLVEEFVSREGTDYGHRDRTLGEKVEDVLLQLASGEARIVFDLESETASIMPARSLPPARR